MKPRSRPLIFRSLRSKSWLSVATMAMLVMSIGLLPISVPIVHTQVAPVGAGFALDAGDLRFIFRQIQIAQAHSAGGTLFGPGPNQVNEPRFPFGLRTVDGSLNHLVPGQTAFGASDQLFPRMTTRFAARQAEAHTFDPDGPGPIQVGDPSDYDQTTGIVNDAQPRIISNLIVDQTISNPAAVAVAAEGGVQLTPADCPPGSSPRCTDTFFIPNLAPDEGLSAPFNGMFTFFGQFFDHGLDLVNKGGSGTVFVPLQTDDPLYNPDLDGPDNILGNGDDAANFMLLTRAARPATPAGSLEAINQTTPFVDQNQTYTSHPSHQAFLREYSFDDPLTPAVELAGPPRSTGRMIDGAGGNIGNWAEVKAQAAAMLGVGLVDSDVSNVPLLVTDAYGYLRRNAAGFPMAMLANGPGPADDTAVVLTPGVPIASSLLAKTNHEFLNDIAHSAFPGPGLTPDPGTEIGGSLDVPPAGTYDDDLLNIHFLTGDGRGNENIALTAVHTIFHSEHNRLQENIHGLIHSGMLTAAEVTAWEAQDAASGWGYGERLFQASRFVTEMQYQHLVFEEFARTLVPGINAFVGDGINFNSGTNPAIPAEFAHAAYRLGHTMLTETISRTRPNPTDPDPANPSGTPTVYDIPLLAGFLNPAEFNYNPDNPAVPLTAKQAAGAIFQGGTRQIGNDIDEFVTEAVRNNLVGLPLDLAVLNIARGRSEGLAPLNEVRRQLFLQTGDFALQPYANWFEFKLAMKHPESLGNFIAAYGVHGSLTAAGNNVAARRAAGEVLSDSNAFLFAPAANTGVNRIDLWVGGIAEMLLPFGSMLGPTLNYIFEITLENLQNADRFYYLERLDGLNLLAQMEANSFSELIERNTEAVGLPAMVFSRPGLTFNVANLLTGDGESLIGPNGVFDDPTTLDIDESQMQDLVQLLNPDGVTYSGQFRYFGGEHVTWNGGNTVGDRAISSIGDDTLKGNGGNDVMEGGAGNDNHVGGAGDDILTDTFGEDVMKGGPGHDAISGGLGPFDLLQGNEGNDFIVAGNDESEVFGGPGNDVIYMGTGLSESIGGSGDDWMEGTVTPASILIGDDNNQFQNDPNGGHDILLAGVGDADFDSEGGDDITVGTVMPTHRFEGMLGFDWTTYRGETVPVDADMLVTGALVNNGPLNESRDRFDLIEGLSGTNFNDLLRGDDRVAADLTTDPLAPLVANAHVLTAAGIARITGLAALLPAGATSFAGGNIILGGPGSDLLEGRGGDDILDGDAWLNVQLRAPNPAVPGAFQLVDSLHALKTDVFAGLINPGTITFVRSIVITSSAGIDTARFTGPRANYTISAANAAGFVTVTDNVGLDGVDRLRNVEQLQFPINDGPDGIPGSGDEVDFLTVSTGNNPPTGTPALSQPLPQELEPVTVSILGVADLDNIVAGSFTFQWQQASEGSAAFVAIAGATAQTFTPQQAQVGQVLRAIVSFTDGGGRLESVTSAPSGVVGDVFPGSAAADIFGGTAGRDNASGLGGNDSLTTGDADDVASGGAGNDILSTGAGNDIANGGAGDDVILTGDGNDSIRFQGANTGFDAVNGGNGTDQMLALANGTVFGVSSVAGVESITSGGFTSVTIQGPDAGVTLNFTAVTLTGILGIVGGAGNDALTGSVANDQINGGTGNDTISGGLGVDDLFGEGGDDTINGDAGDDGVSGGAGNDTINGGDGADGLAGDAGNDVIAGGAGNDQINGGAGNDTIDGGVGNDNLNGAAGSDIITGGAGNDTMNPGATIDTDEFRFAAGFGVDVINGFGATPVAGVVGQDLLNVSALGITAATFEANVIRAQVGANTRITIGANTITLNGVLVGTVTAADFILAP